MKICDRCSGTTRATQTVLFVEDDVRFDLCDKHKNEIAGLISTKEKPIKEKIFGRKKDSAKAG